MKKTDFIEWNEGMFKKYNNVRLYEHPNPIIRFTENKRLRIILNELKGEKVADIGCGEGYLLSRINSEFLVGVDISETAIKRASKISNALLVRADAESLPFSDNYFDGVVCSETIEHTLNPDRVLSEISRIAAPGANIIISIPNEPLINKIKDFFWNAGLFNLVFPNVPKRQNDEWHIHSFDLKKLQSLCAGKFEIEKIHSIPFGFLPIRYVFVCRNLKTGQGKSDKLFISEPKRKDGYLDAL